MNKTMQMIISLNPDGYLTIHDAVTGKAIMINPRIANLSVTLTIEHPNISVLAKPIDQVIEMQNFELRQ